MSDIAKEAIDKLKIIKEMSQAPETQQLAKVLITYIENTNKSSIGFEEKK